MWIHQNQNSLVLAPMEGVTDAPMRALVTKTGAFDYCVTEFLRITCSVPPKHVYHRILPELAQGGRTESGCPVQLQLLGGDPEILAASAVKAVEYGALAIDINFGCPAKTVNSHDGGAAILKCPARVKAIVGKVRDAVPTEIPVSAKLRLGWQDPEEIFVVAKEAEAGGADWITIHARTREQGYGPPVRWDILGKVIPELKTPVVANGDIWDTESFQRCEKMTGAKHFMLGRGAVANPLFPLVARHILQGEISNTAMPSLSSVSEWRPWVNDFVHRNYAYGQLPFYLVRRIKQWIKMASMPQKLEWFEEMKTLGDIAAMDRFFDQKGAWERMYSAANP